eukprot:TRINITY_DN24950_c0_g1_i3.p1 TRINITY_DN24950_c0_g1~~TRINITY_DN24950_c0_g1_i3.p1  ORF type:complete len:327 (+),score=39.17 TRINITY_DN24950_c0_g1_i3:97-1077(+)
MEALNKIYSFEGKIVDLTWGMDDLLFYSKKSFEVCSIKLIKNPHNGDLTFNENEEVVFMNDQQPILLRYQEETSRLFFCTDVTFEVKYFDLESKRSYSLGSNGKRINTMHLFEKDAFKNLVSTCDCDGNIKLWDTRKQGPINTTSDLKGNKILASWLSGATLFLCCENQGQGSVYVIEKYLSKDQQKIKKIEDSIEPQTYMSFFPELKFLVTGAPSGIMNLFDLGEDSYSKALTINTRASDVMTSLSVKDMLIFAGRDGYIRPYRFSKGEVPINSFLKDIHRKIDNDDNFISFMLHRPAQFPYIIVATVSENSKMLILRLDHRIFS